MGRWPPGAAVALCALAACATPAPPPPPPPVAAQPAPATPPANPCAGDCLADVERLLAANPERGRARIQTCLGCPDTSVQAYARAADVSARDHALAILRTGTERHPQAALLWRLRGRVALDTGFHDEGIAALTRAAHLRPEDPGVQSELQTARRALPDHAPSVARALARADKALAGNDLRGARLALDEAATAATRPEDRALVHHRRALVALVAEDHPLALRETKAGLRTAPAHARALRAELLVTLADLHIAERRAEDALIAATAATELAPSDPLAQTNLAAARALGGDLDGALAALRAAIDAGLPERLARADLEAIAAFAPLLERPDARALVNEAWR